VQWVNWTDNEELEENKVSWFENTKDYKDGSHKKSTAPLAANTAIKYFSYLGQKLQLERLLAAFDVPGLELTLTGWTPGKVVEGKLESIQAVKMTDSSEYDPFLQASMAHNDCRANIAVAMQTALSPEYFLKMPQFFCPGKDREFQKKFIEKASGPSIGKPLLPNYNWTLPPNETGNLMHLFERPDNEPSQYSAMRYNKPRWSEKCSTEEVAIGQSTTRAEKAAHLEAALRQCPQIDRTGFSDGWEPFCDASKLVSMQVVSSLQPDEGSDGASSQCQDWFARADNAMRSKINSLRNLYVDTFLQGCEVVLGAYNAMKENEQEESENRMQRCTSMMGNDTVMAATCPAVVPNGIPLNDGAAASTCQDVSDDQMLQLSGNQLPSCVAAAGMCTHAEWGAAITEACPLTCGTCTAAPTPPPSPGGSNECAATSDSDKAAAIAALTDASSEEFPSLVLQLAQDDPCLFDGSDWVEGTQCTDLALRVIDAALPALDLLQPTPGSASPNSCITERGEGYCGNFADTVCYSANLPGSPQSRLVRLLQMVNHTSHGLAGKSEVSRYMLSSANRAESRWLKNLQVCEEGCRLVQTRPDGCDTPPAATDFSPAAIKHTFNCNGMANYDFFNLRFGNLGGALEEVGLAKDYMMMMPEDEAISPTSKGDYTVHNFTVKGKVPKHMYFPDDTYCCKEPNAMDMVLWPKKLELAFSSPTSMTTWSTLYELDTCTMSIQYEYATCFKMGAHNVPVSTTIASGLVDDNEGSCSTTGTACDMKRGACKRWFARADATIRFLMAQRRLGVNCNDTFTA